MDLARSLDTPKHGTIVRAGYQHSGRGRIAGRSWEGEKDLNLLCTAVFESGRFDFPPLRLPILVGVAVAWSVEGITSGRSEIKWPNDVLVHRLKIAGILCEAHRERIYVGIGLNCNQVAFSDTLKSPAVSLRLILGAEVEIASVCERLLNDLFRAIGSSDWHRELDSRLFSKGKSVTIERDTSDGPRREVVTILGVAADGALEIRNESGDPEKLYAGEVTFKS